MTLYRVAAGVKEERALGLTWAGQPAARSANTQMICDCLDAGHRHANTTVMADAFDDLATVVNLPQFALGVVLVTTVNHQIIHDHAETCADTKRVFNELMGLHKTPFTSRKSENYM
jgi:hypothetical protein